MLHRPILVPPRSKRRYRPPPFCAKRLVLTLCILLLLTFCVLRIRRRSRPTFNSTTTQRATDNPLGALILSSPFAANIIVSEVNRLIFCPVPKAANSNWKYLVRKWEGLSDYADLSAAHSPLRSGLRYLSDYSAPEVEQLLKDPRYFRFLFVRDPYTRLVSCYMDKFRNEDREYVSKEYRAFLAHLFGWRYARTVDIYNDPRPSFRAFVEQLAKIAPQEMNAHWKPQTLLCGIGLVPYDFVGKMENLTEDVDTVFRRLGRPNERFPTQQEIGFPPSGASKAVVDDLYTLDLIYKVRVIYEADFRLLGYV